MASITHNHSQPIFVPDEAKPSTLLRVGPNLEERQRLAEEARIAANEPQGRYADGRYAPKGAENVVFTRPSRKQHKQEREDHSIAKTGSVIFIGLTAIAGSMFGSTPSHTTKAPEK